jgi:hypothetical protein
MTKELTARVYQYGTVPARVAPVIGEAAADGQLRLAGRLWNVLVAIERARVERYRIIMRDEGQERIDSLRHQISTLRDEIKARRKAVRARNVETKDLTDAIGAARAELGAAIETQKASSAARHDAKRADLAALNERTKRRIKRARQAAASLGLFWGTYNDIVARADTGCKAGELHFRRYAGDGTLTAQIMGGATVARCIGGEHSFFVVDPSINGQKWTRARMRIGSTADRAPVWLDVPIVMHRPIPAGAMIKSVSMTRRNLRWTVNITVTAAAPKPKLQGPSIAIDLGWRLLPHGVRVAYCIDDAGQEQQVVVSTADIGEFGRIRSVRSICDCGRDHFLPIMVAWLAGRDLPEQWRTQTAALAQWRSGDRLAALIRWWADHRLDGDEQIYITAQEWRKQYLHLANWWRNLENQMRARVREQYRIFAARVARDYAAVYLEEFDLREVAEKAPAESEAQNTASSGYRQMVSPSMLRAAVKNACFREGVRVVDLPAEYTTRVCHHCGYAGQWDQASAVMHRCDGCGRLWDQDANAARNLLALGLASGEAAPTKNQRDRVRKWDRVRSLSEKAPQTIDSKV